MLSFSSVVSELNMNKTKIFNKIFTHFVIFGKRNPKLDPKKRNRLMHLTRLFATICKDCGTFDQKSHDENILDFVSEFLNQNIDLLDLDETALLLEQLIFKLIPQKQHIFFVFKLFGMSSIYSKSYSKFATILLQRRELLKSIGNKNMDIQLNFCIQDVYNSFVTRPSSQYSTCRMLMASNDVKSTNLVVKNILEDIMQKIMGTSQNDYVSDEVIDCLANTTQIMSANFIWKNSQNLLSVSEHDAKFISITKFYPLIFLSCPRANVLFNQTKEKVIDIFTQNSTTPYIFIAGIEALDAYSKRLMMDIQMLDEKKKNYKEKVQLLEKERHDFIMKCVQSFARCIREHDSYYSYQCLGILAERDCNYESIEQSFKYLLTIFFTSCRFSVLFPVICSIASKFKDVFEAEMMINREVINVAKKEILITYLERKRKEEIDLAMSINEL